MFFPQVQKTIFAGTIILAVCSAASWAQPPAGLAATADRTEPAPAWSTKVITAGQDEDSITPEPSEPDPDVARALRDGGRRMRTGQYEKAAEIYREILKKDPFNKQARFELGAALIQMKTYKEAAELFEAMLKDFPNDYQVENNIAWLYATAVDPAFRDPERAIRLAQSAVFNKPDNFHVWSTLAEAHYAAGHYDKALRAAEQTLLLSGESPDGQALQQSYRRFLEKCRKAAGAMSVVE